MKESGIRRSRKCKTCQRSVYGDAKAMKEHQGYHNLADRMARSGLVLAQPRVILPGEEKA